MDEHIAQLYKAASRFDEGEIVGGEDYRAAQKEGGA